MQMTVTDFAVSVYALVRHAALFVSELASTDQLRLSRSPRPWVVQRACSSVMTTVRSTANLNAYILVQDGMRAVLK